MNISDILSQARQNENFRKVLATGKKTQVVIMSIPADGEIGEEVHPDNDQVLLLIEGKGKAIIDGEESAFNPGDLVLVPAGAKHNFVSQKSMKIVTTYSPPHHPEGMVHATKAEADAAE